MWFPFVLDSTITFVVYLSSPNPTIIIEIGFPSDSVKKIRHQPPDLVGRPRTGSRGR